MDLKGTGAYDCQVADSFSNRKQTLMQNEITQILDLIEQHSEPRNNSQGSHNVCNEWMITVSLDNSHYLGEEVVAQESTCQVVNFMERKAIIDRANSKGKENGNVRNLSLVKSITNQEIERKNHFLAVDQKLRKCMQQKKTRLFWKRTLEVFSRVLKKL